MLSKTGNFFKKGDMKVFQNGQLADLMMHDK